MSDKKANITDEQSLLKIHRSLLKGWWVFATVCLFMVALSIFLVVFYINTIQGLLAANQSIPLQSSSDILNLSIPILSVFAGFLVSFLGMKRFENIDNQLEGIKKNYLLNMARNLLN